MRVISDLDCSIGHESQIGPCATYLKRITGTCLLVSGGRMASLRQRHGTTVGRRKVSRLQRKTTLSRIECARSKQVGLNAETKKGVGIEPAGEIFLLTFTLIGRFCNAQPDRSVHPLDRHLGPAARASRLSFAKTPRQPNFVHVTCYTASLYVVDFKCAETRRTNSLGRPINRFVTQRARRSGEL
jgi:hypothetical protein